MPQLFLDCDGVLADFDRGARKVLRLPPREFEAQYGFGLFWRRLANATDFYARLPLTPDAMELYEGVRGLNPIILTGLPRGGWAEEQKRRWAKTRFPDLSVIACMAVDKRDYCRIGDILIDDTLKHRHLWESANGVFIRHTSARNSLNQLRALGILPAPSAAMPQA